MLVLVRAPGREGEANVTMVDGIARSTCTRSSSTGRRGLDLAVTPWDLTGFERVNLWNDEGLIASAAIRRA